MVIGAAYRQNLVPAILHDGNDVIVQPRSPIFADKAIPISDREYGVDVDLRVGGHNTFFLPGGASLQDAENC
jgi:hypothetical protein